MRDLNAIIEDYRHSDSERRLYLFLDCPSLRNEFIRIDREEVPLMDKARETSSRPLKPNGLRALFASLRHAWSYKVGIFNL